MSANFRATNFATSVLPACRDLEAGHEGTLDRPRALPRRCSLHALECARGRARTARLRRAGVPRGPARVPGPAAKNSGWASERARRRGRLGARRALPIDLATVTYGQQSHELGDVVHVVHDPVVPDARAVRALSPELLRSVSARVLAEPCNLLAHARSAARRRSRPPLVTHASASASSSSSSARRASTSCATSSSVRTNVRTASL